MSAPDTTKIQVNLKTPGGTLLNIYATSEADAALQLDSLRKLAEDVTSTEAIFGAAQAVAHTPPASQQQAGPPAPTCRHGAMTYKEGTSKAGKPYKAHFCPSRDRNDSCDPIWSR